jgi:putative transposase
MLTYKFRLLPKKAQVTTFERWLEECRMLTNNFISQRKDGWEKEKKKYSLYDQHKQLPDLKTKFPNLKQVHSQVLQNVGMRVDDAYNAFFRRLKRHEKPGYPRFKGYERYDSFCYPCAADIKTGPDWIHLPKIGKVNVIFHRKMEGKLKTATVKKSHGKWYLTIVTDHVRKDELPENSNTVAIDVGIETFATLSDGKSIKNPRFFEKKQRQLARAQRQWQKLKDAKSKDRLKKKRRAVAKIHEKIANSRHNFVHQTTKGLVRDYGTIVIEDINVNSMLKKRWCNKQILDAAWGYFADVLAFKAECAGRKLVKVNPAYTSQTCSKCGTRTLHELKDRIFNCACGYSAGRDENASLNILTLGLQSLAQA